MSLTGQLAIQVEPGITDRFGSLLECIASAGGERVYFIRAGAFVKIGKESGPVIGARLRDLQTGCPWPMHLVAVLPGGLERERELHLRFAHLRVRNNGEWFHERGALAQFIAQLEPVQ